eukprot:INCI2812.2.p1 GENE.INCI2812.2~~INCI2812.2.p1  ORF type:complete len:657 (-),score=137.56 INCI2812.2:262-2070(-)
MSRAPHAVGAGAADVGGPAAKRARRAEERAGTAVNADAAAAAVATAGVRGNVETAAEAVATAGGGAAAGDGGSAGAAAAAAAAAEAAGGSAGPGGRQSKSGVVDQEKYDELVKFVKKHRSKAMSKVERLDILLLHGFLRHDHYLKKKKLPRGSVPPANATGQISKMLRRQREVVNSVWSEYAKHGRVTVADAPANRQAKESKVPNTPKISSALRAFIRKRRERQEKTVARDVLDFLQSSGLVSFDLRKPSAALRNVQRMLVRKGYCRGHRKRTQQLKLRETNLCLRDQYVLRMQKYTAEKRRIVYVDENFIHHRYSRRQDALFDHAMDDEMSAGRSGGAHDLGKRFNFIAAIVDADRRVPESLQNENQKANLLLESLDIFEGGEKQTKDYHGMFSHTYFVKWLQTLCDCLKDRGIENAVIVMDNAKCHKALPADTPRSGNKKSALVGACHRYGLPVAAEETRETLWAKLKPYIRDHVDPVAVAVAKQAGHEVLFTPPRYSGLQPTETVWAIVKGEVGRQYTAATKAAQVRARLVAAFRSLKSQAVQGCITKANRALRDLQSHIEHMQEVEEEESSDANSAVEVSSDSDEEESGGGLLSDLVL